jgi:hypothetical protein
MKILIHIIIIVFINYFYFSCSTSSEPSDKEESKGYLDRVRFSEVYLDTTNYSKTWIEVYNPTEEDIQVDGGRYSHIKCMNCFSNYFIVTSQNYFVLCANDSVFESNYGKRDNLMEMSFIGSVPNWGGFFSIYTKRDSVKIGDAFRFGLLCQSNTKEWLDGSDIVPFVSGDSSFSLTVSGKNDVCNLYKFEKSSPTPGY